MTLFDMRTILFGYILSSTVCTGMLAWLWSQNRRRYAGLAFWLADYALQGVAVLLVALRGSVPDFLSVVVGNTLLVGSGLVLLIGLERFAGLASRPAHNYLLLAAFAAVHTYFLYGWPSLSARNINLSVGLLVMGFQCAWLMLRRVDARLRPITRGGGQVLAAYGVVSLGRLGVELVVPSGNDFLQAGLASAGPVLIYQMLLICLTFSLCLMVNCRLYGETRQLAAFPQLNPNPVLAVDPNGAIAFCNPAVGDNLRRIGAPPDPRAFVPADVDRLLPKLAGGEAAAFYREVTLGDVIFGEDIYVLPQFAAVHIYAHDITARVRAEQARQQAEAEVRRLNEDLEQRIAVRTAELSARTAQVEGANRELRASEEKYRTVADFTYDWEYWLAPTGQYVYVSPACERITGYRPEEFQSDPGLLAAIVHPADRAQAAACLHPPEPDGSPRTADFRIVTRSGETRWIDHWGQAVYTAEGGYLGQRGSNRDITLQKQAEAALRDSDAKYRALFSEMMNGAALHALLCDAAGQAVDYVTLEVNRAYETLLGVKREDITGQRASGWLPPDELAKWVGIFGPVALTGHSASYEMLDLRK